MIKQISNQEIEDARAVLNSFVVSRVYRESALEAGIFAIANQSARWERPTKIIYAMREEAHRGDEDARDKYTSLGLLMNVNRVHNIAVENGYRFRHQHRFGPMIKYFGPITDKWWEDIVNAGNEQRDFYTEQIKFLQCKTFSFWHLCLGGTNLLPIDIHVRRQVRSLGVEIDEKYVVGKNRPHRKKRIVQEPLMFELPSQMGLRDKADEEYETQSVVEEPDKKEYLRIEADILKLFSTDPRFMKESKVDAGLVASVLWWRGANRNGQHQRNLFSDTTGGHWQLPYGDAVR